MTRSQDVITPFLINESQIRGRIFKTSKLINELIAKQNYHRSINKILSELLIITPLVASLIKSTYSVTLQVKSTKLISTIIIDYFDNIKLRAHIRIDDNNLIKDELEYDYLQLIGGGQLIISILQSVNAPLYQAIVALNSVDLASSIEQYFLQSEQIPTKLKIELSSYNNYHQAGGIIIQALPDQGSINQEDWIKNSMFINTITKHELTNNQISAQDLLFKLFHEQGVIVYPNTESLIIACKCSRYKAQRIIAALSQAELAELMVNQQITVECEFCHDRQIFQYQEV